DVAEDGYAGLVAGALLDLACQPRADAALREPDVAELIQVARLVEPLELVALAHDDDREGLATLVALADLLAGVVDRDRLLGDHDHVGAAGDPAHDGDPARVAAHHLDDHHAVVRLGGGVEPVDRLGADPDRGVEAEGVVGAGEVVVDRLRDADDRKVVLRVELRRDPERVLAADRHERVELCALEVRQHRLGAALELEGIRARGAEDRPAPRQQPGDLARPERLELPVDEPAPALADADHLVPARERAPRDRANHRVQAGTIPATREHADLHRCRRWESNPHGACTPPDLESGASTTSATSA